MGVKRYLRSRQYRLVYNEPHQSGINMVDLMMWLVIAALIIAAALQAIGSYQKGAYIYHMKNDLEGAVSVAAANGASSGTIDEAHVAAAVANSNKSEGVTLTWGIIASSSSAAGTTDGTPLANHTAGSPNILLMSSVASSKPVIKRAGTTSEGPNSSYVLIAHHAKVPDLEVIYFFDSVNHFSSGYSILPTQPDMEIAGGLEVYWISGNKFWDPAVSGAGDGAYIPPATPPATAAPASPVPTTAPSPAATSPATSAATPPATTSPAPSPSVEPSSSPSPSTAPVRPTYLPPVTPAENLDPNNKKFMFCHDGMMHSNSFNGMVQGHEHHPDDIMPPIPPQNYPGHNWNSVTAQTFYNNCVPVG